MYKNACTVHSYNILKDERFGLNTLPAINAQGIFIEKVDNKVQN